MLIENTGRYNYSYEKEEREKFQAIIDILKETQSIMKLKNYENIECGYVESPWYVYQKDIIYLIDLLTKLKDGGTIG